MGRIKEWIIGLEEDKLDNDIAQILGITYDELQELEWELLTEESAEGLIYNYVLQFSPSDSSNKILAKIPRLNNKNFVRLQPWELDDKMDYDDEFDAITDNKNFLERYETEIKNLENLTNLELEDKDLKSILNRQMFIGIIGTMETFLADVFINLTFDNEKYFKNFIKNHPEFQKRKFQLREIFDESEKLRETAKKVMIDTIYHKLPTVREMYKSTFNIDFPEIKSAYEYVLKRHDLVHRNGKTKEGEIVVTDQNAVKELIKTINELVFEVADKLNIRKASG